MRLRARTLTVATLVVLLAGCAVNPVTGRPELVLRSTESERRLGAEQFRQVEALLGVSDDPELATYVSALGERLAVHSPRQNVEYRFTVVDLEVANALPDDAPLGRSRLIKITVAEPYAVRPERSRSPPPARYTAPSQPRRPS
jgi:predicted Zn-dependent protease